MDTTVDRIVSLAWGFVTVPSPIVVCQPDSFDPSCMDQETYHWTPKAKNCVLVYTGPVVYRSYHGTLARKGTVGTASDKAADTASDKAADGTCQQKST